MSARATKPLLVNGPSGVGKTTIGQRLARSAGAAFVDLDHRFATLTGSWPAEFARKDGELRYREVELEVLDTVLGQASPSTVIAVGGGTLLDTAVRRKVLERARVVSLLAPNSVLCERVERRERSKSRGAFAGVENREAAIARYMSARMPAYMEAHERVSTHGVSERVVISRVHRAWHERSVVVPLGCDSYPVWLDGDLGVDRAAKTGTRFRNARHLVGHASEVLARSGLTPPRANTPWLVVDSSVPSRVRTRVARSLRARVTQVSASGKRGWDSYLELLEAANRYDVRRTTLTVAMGGGAVGDLAGYVAATWMRGVPVAHVPTTLLAMIDSAIGGKTGLDVEVAGTSGFAKNVVGAFHQPVGVLIDTRFVKSLSKRAYASALGEITKYAVLDDRLDWLEARLAGLLARDATVLEEVIEACVAFKARIVAMDPQDHASRLALNLGHMWGHAVESASAGALLHGEAVGIGLCFELAWMERTCDAHPGLRLAVERVLHAAGLPTRATLWSERAHDFLDADKKRAHGEARMYRVHGNRGVIDTIPWRRVRREFRTVARFLDRTTRNV